MRRPTPPEPSEILEELAGEVLAPMDRGAVTSFSDALDGMIDFHAFLLRAHTIVNEQGQTDSYAFIPEGFSTIHERWKRQYHRIFERAGDLLGREPDFFKRAATVPFRLVDRTAAAVPSQILDSLLELTLGLFHRGGDWWLRRATEEIGKRPNVREPASLSGYEADIYERTMRDFVGTWENFQYFPKGIWKWETRSLPPAERWERLRASMGFIRQHLRCTAYMVAAAVWRGDEFSASVMSDSLIMWPRSFDHEFSDDIWLKIALLNPDLSERTWENALTELQFEKPAFEHELAPEAVFRAIIENLWIDVLLTLSSVIAAWGFGWGDRSGLPSRVSRKLLFAEATEPEADLRRSDLAPGTSARQVLLTLIRQYTSGERFRDSSYRGWLNGLVSMFDNLTEREVVPGRGYTPSTKHELDDLRLFQLAILMSQADPNNSADLPTNLEEAIISISRLPGTDEPARRLKGELGDFRKFLGEMSATEWLPVLTGFSKTDAEVDNYDGRKTAINDLLAAALDLVQRERTARVEKLAVQQERIDELAGVISNNVLGGDVHTFPLCKLIIAPRTVDLAENTIFRQPNYDKGSLTEPKMAYPISNEQEAFSSVVSRTINARLLHEVLSANTVEDIAIADHVLYWETVKEKGTKLADQGLEPLLLVRSQVEPLWISRWIWDRGSRADTPKPEDLSVSRDSSELTEGYLATFNNIKVQVAPVARGVSFVLPREIFQSLEIRTFANGHQINIQFQQNDDPWHGDLVFSWAHRLQVPSYPISRLIHSNVDD